MAPGNARPCAKRWGRALTALGRPAVGRVCASPSASLLLPSGHLMRKHHGAKHKLTRVCQPQINDIVERYNLTKLQCIQYQPPAQIFANHKEHYTVNPLVCHYVKRASAQICTITPVPDKPLLSLTPNPRSPGAESWRERSEAPRPLAGRALEYAQYGLRFAPAAHIQGKNSLICVEMARF